MVLLAATTSLSIPDRLADTLAVLSGSVMGAPRPPPVPSVPGRAHGYVGGLHPPFRVADRTRPPGVGISLHNALPAVRQRSVARLVGQRGRYRDRVLIDQVGKA